MHNFDDLQKRCKKYKLRKILTYFLLSIFIILTAVILYIYHPLHETTTLLDKKKPVKPKTTITTHTIKETKPQKEVKEVSKIKKENHKKIHTAVKQYSLQFLAGSPHNINNIKKEKKHLENLGFSNCKLQQSVIYIHLTCYEVDTLQELDPYIELAQKNDLEYVIRTQNKKTLQKKTIPKRQLLPQNPQKKAPSQIKVQNTDIKQLQKRFTQTPNYAVALVIARNYYKETDYKKAIVWAKKANQLNKSDAGSWMIYAKSLYALHKEAKAKQLLHIYLQYENSDAVKNLLQQWEHMQ